LQKKIKKNLKKKEKMSPEAKEALTLQLQAAISFLEENAGDDFLALTALHYLRASEECLRFAS